MDKSNKIDILHGPILKKMIIFALPLALGSVFQQLFNMVDSAVVGQFASSEALAAVGANASVVNFFVNFFVGISLGSGVLIANYIGSGNHKNLSKCVHTSIAFSLICGVFLAGFIQFVANPILLLMDTPSDIMNLAVVYLRIYAIGMPFILLYNFGAAILRSVGDSKHPFYALIIGGVLNAILNLVFVIVFKMSVTGVALATAISNVISALIVIYYLMNENDEICFSFRKLAISKNELIRILKIGLPAGLQGTIASISNIVIQSCLNSFGSSVVAGSSAAVNFEYVGYCMVTGFSQAATTFIGQNYGAGQMKRCYKILRLALITGISLAFAIDIIIVLLREPLTLLFTSDTKVIPYATQRILQIMGFHWLTGTYDITSSALRGYGKSVVPAFLVIFGTCFIRLIWVYVVNHFYHTYAMLLLVYPVSWIITGSLVIGYYFIVKKKQTLA